MNRRKHRVPDLEPGYQGLKSPPRTIITMGYLLKRSLFNDTRKLGRKGLFDWLLIPTPGTIRHHYLGVDQ
jgi:hypothetical protein